jgi:hypothetical protein
MLEALVREIDATRERILLPEWGQQPLHGLPRTAYGYVMNAMALVDLLSQYRAGSSTGPQTPRMVRFLIDYLGYSDLASRVLVQLWRHTLMHTGRPREARGSRTGDRYSYLLQWGEKHLPRADHMQFQPAAHDPRILNLGVQFLAEDLLAGARKYFDHVRKNKDLETAKFSAHDDLIQPTSFTD